SDDIRQATKVARAMITEYGMSDLMGTIAYGERDDVMLYQFGPGSKNKDYSEATAREIDDEVKRIISEQYKRARDLIESHTDRLDAIAEALLERETLGAPEIDALMAGQPLPPA